LHGDSSAHDNITKIKEESVSSDSKDDLVVVKERKVSKSGRASGGGDGGIRVKTNDNSDKDGIGGVIVVGGERYDGRSAKKKRKKTDKTPSEKRENKRKKENAAVEWEYSGIEAAPQESAHQLQSGDVLPKIRARVEKISSKQERHNTTNTMHQAVAKILGFKFAGKTKIEKEYRERLEAKDLDYGPLPEVPGAVECDPCIEQQRRLTMKAGRLERERVRAELAKQHDEMVGQLGTDKADQLEKEKAGSELRPDEEFSGLLDLTAEVEAAIKASEETLKDVLKAGDPVTIGALDTHPWTLWSKEYLLLLGETFGAELEIKQLHDMGGKSSYVQYAADLQLHDCTGSMAQIIGVMYMTFRMNARVSLEPVKVRAFVLNPEVSFDDSWASRGVVRHNDQNGLLRYFNLHITFLGSRRMKIGIPLNVLYRGLNLAQESNYDQNKLVEFVAVQTPIR
jgi:hypothetical protein